MKKTIIIFLIAIIFISCDEKIDLTLPASPSRLIVEGRVELIKSTSEHEQQIVISTLNDFFDQSQTPRVDNAVVRVIDGNGEVYPYQHDDDDPGRYFNTDLNAEIGESYTLQIEWNQEFYEASSILVEVTPLDSVYQVFEEENAFEDGGLKLAIDFTDPIGEDNYYFWELFADGQNLILADPGNSGNVIANDRFWDGQKIEGYFPNEERVLEPGMEVIVRHIGISKETFDYLFLLFEQTGQTGQFIDVPPALIRGNIQNLTNPENIAMGYFGASEVDQRSLIVSE